MDEKSIVALLPRPKLSASRRKTLVLRIPRCNKLQHERM